MNVLFVCTGNIFRSMSAEYLLKDLLKKRQTNGITVSSAGTQAIPETLPKACIDALHSFRIDPTPHHQRKVSPAILASNDLIVSMAKEHQDHLWNKFRVNSHLFNEIAHGKETSIPDVWEAVPDFDKNPVAKNKYIMKTIYYIHDSMPDFLDQARRFDK